MTLADFRELTAFYLAAPLDEYGLKLTEYYHANGMTAWHAAIVLRDYKLGIDQSHI